MASHACVYGDQFTDSRKKLLATDPGDLESLRGGRRVGTLRSREESVEKISNFVAINVNLGYPTSRRPLHSLSGGRASEPRNRGALRKTRMLWLSRRSIRDSNRRQGYRTSDLQDHRRRSFILHLTRCLKHASRFFISVVCALERSVMNTETEPHLRLYSWWLLLQFWCAFRVSDHLGVKPKGGSRHWFLSVSSSDLVPDERYGPGRRLPASGRRFLLLLHPSNLFAHRLGSPQHACSV